MKSIPYHNGSYRTPPGSTSKITSLVPTASFYTRFIWEVVTAAQKAKKKCYDGEAWVQSSWNVLKSLEGVGVTFDVQGIENIRKADGPVVFIGNHMSALETTILPVLAFSEKPLCFVIKQSLLEYPVFKHVAGARHPIAVTRTNPRADLKAMMADGVERLQSGRSVVVFPQTTRAHTFSPEEMSTIGVKLAKKAGVPVIPLALKTDAWGNGKKLKDFGKIDTEKTVHFSFGNPIEITSKGAEEQKQICHFIEAELNKWQS